MKSKSKALKGYSGRDTISHRKYNFQTSVKRYLKSGKISYRGIGKAKGSGHTAGQKWGAKKDINPESITTKYSKNSPSFDEGVFLYKQEAKSKALKNLKN